VVSLAAVNTYQGMAVPSSFLCACLARIIGA
jgi:hypothetical protein